ncbi:hypothetical protein [Rhodococcus sp. SGAir0479]|uniref:hypothetical protein n=1 Tax=Rhodococcus sp. SGAir0479 TaxID=2567884 RepID=UPI0015868CA0|nr:hypothetical protein [Rhodococcus sp. SGAir0479]
MTQHDTGRTGQDEVHEDPPGPADHGRDGGMATRENAPDVVRRSDSDEDDS